MVGRSGAINIKEVAEIGGSAAAIGAGASAFAPRRRVFLTGAAASTTVSTVVGAFEFARRVAGFAASVAAAGLARPFFATVFAGALIGVLAGALASALTAGFAAAFVATLLTGFFESVTGAFVSFLITISGALQAACVWATLTSC
jgi:hypothetical protein